MITCVTFDEKEQEPKVSRKTVAVTDDLMALPDVMIGSTVMLHFSCREGRLSHNAAHRDLDGRWYVRKGKRGAVKRYLTECEITYLDGEVALYQFKTDYLLLMADFEHRITENRSRQRAA